MPGHITMDYDRLLSEQSTKPSSGHLYRLSISLPSTTVNIDTSDPMALEKTIEAIEQSQMPLLMRLFCKPKQTIVFSGKPQVAVNVNQIVAVSFTILQP